MNMSKWMSTVLLIVTVGLTVSQLDDDGETIALSVWVGQEVDLECGDNISDTIGRLWKRGDEAWLFMNEVIVHNDRIRSVNSSAIMRIVNVTLDDEGYYTCTAIKRPHKRTLRLQVKEMPCESPEKPLNGDFESDTDTYRTGDTIRYHCHRGYRLIGQSNRTCTGTHNGWQPQEPHCQPEYIGHLLTRLNGIEAEMIVFKQSIATLENNTLQVINRISGLENKVTAIDSKVTAIDSRVSAMNGTMSAKTNKVYSVVSNASDIYNISKMESLEWHIDRERLVACTDVTKAIDEDTVTKCKTMQWGARNGHHVSVYTWVIENFNSKILEAGNYFSQPFYQTVPGYKFGLYGSIHFDGDIFIYLHVIPGEYDEQLKWPLNQRHDMTVLTNDGLEVLHRSTSSGDQSHCQLNGPSSKTDYDCYMIDSNWDDVYRNKKHILSDGSVVAKLYLYN